MITKLVRRIVLSGISIGASAIVRGGERWPASPAPRAQTRRRTCSKSWFAPGSAATMSIIARGSAMPPLSRH